MQDDKKREEYKEKVAMPTNAPPLPTECHAHLFVLQVHKLDSHEVHSEDETVGVRPEPLVVHREEGAAVERVMFHRR